MLLHVGIVDPYPLVRSSKGETAHFPHGRLSRLQSLVEDECLGVALAIVHLLDGAEAVKFALEKRGGGPRPQAADPHLKRKIKNRL